jgi:HSP20 family molecular chaperone IbpA
MSDKRTEMQKTEPVEVATAEQTRPGPVYTPAVDIFETPDALTLLADMPGVQARNLKIDLREGVLTLHGVVEAQPRAGEEDLFVELAPGSYYRQFTVSDVIDQGRIEAKLTDGVLRLHLPKVEAVKPRQITVKVG